MAKYFLILFGTSLVLSFSAHANDFPTLPPLLFLMSVIGLVGLIGCGIKKLIVDSKAPPEAVDKTYAPPAQPTVDDPWVPVIIVGVVSLWAFMETKSFSSLWFFLFWCIGAYYIRDSIFGLLKSVKVKNAVWRGFLVLPAILIVAVDLALSRIAGHIGSALNM